MSTYSKRYRDLLDLVNEFAEAKDVNVLMEQVLQTAREFARCDAGSIYLRKGPVLEFRYAQNDTLQRLEPGRRLIYTTFSVPLDHQSITGHVALSGETVHIPDVRKLGHGVPYRFDDRFDRRTSYETRSILTTPLKNGLGEIIGVLQLINALDADGRVTGFARGIATPIAYFTAIAGAALERAMLTRNVLMRMVRMTELRDPHETGNHVRRVAGYSVEIYESWARHKGLSRQEIDHNRDVLHIAAMLHDVGKAAIEDSVLKKPGRLTPEEFEVIKGHTIQGALLLDNPLSECEQVARVVALTHHEKFDGTGYPGHIDPSTGEPLPRRVTRQGLPRPCRGEEIPIWGRIVAVADVYDALSTQRSYKTAWEHEQVLAYIWEQRGGHFDPAVVDAFFDSLLVIATIAEQYPEGKSD